MDKENLVGCVSPSEKASPKNHKSNSQKKRRKPNLLNETKMTAKALEITIASSDIGHRIEVMPTTAIGAQVFPLVRCGSVPPSPFTWFITTLLR